MKTKRVSALVALLAVVTLILPACRRMIEEDDEFSVTVAPTLNGTVFAGATKAKEGDNVFLFISPDPGYRLQAGSLTVFGGGSMIRVTPMGDTMVSFTMPAAGVTVSCIFESTGDPPLPGSVTVTPSTWQLTQGQGGTRQFSASPADTYTWTVNNAASTAGGSSINSSGFLTVSASEPAGTLTVRATSAADSTKVGTATVTISSGGTPPSGAKPVVFNGIWGADNTNGVPMYPSDDCLEVWPDGYGISYDSPVTDGYNGSTMAIWFNHSAATEQWAGAAIFFDSGSGIIANQYNLKFHIKGNGSLERIGIARYGYPWAANDVNQFQNFTGPGISGTFADWTEVTVTLNSTNDEVGALLFVMGNSAGTNLYIDNIMFVPK